MTVYTFYSYVFQVSKEVRSAIMFIKESCLARFVVEVPDFVYVMECRIAEGFTFVVFDDDGA